MLTVQNHNLRGKNSVVQFFTASVLVVRLTEQRPIALRTIDYYTLASK